MTTKFEPKGVLLTSFDVAEYLSLKESTVAKLMSNGDIVSVAFENKKIIRTTKEQVDLFIQNLFMENKNVHK